METLVGNEEVPLTKEDCLEYIQIRNVFALRVKLERLGQAWFNCLDLEDQQKLIGSFFDPFYKDSWADVIRALRFLLEN